MPCALAPDEVELQCHRCDGLTRRSPVVADDASGPAAGSGGCGQEAGTSDLTETVL